jgi:hypothetical protein
MQLTADKQFLDQIQGYTRSSFSSSQKNLNFKRGGRRCYPRSDLKIVEYGGEQTQVI